MQWRRWRWLWIWVGVLVTGCGQFWSSESPSTPEPTRPLFGYTLLPPSRTPAFRPVYTATPLFTLDSTSATRFPVALYLAVSAPVCYETPVGSLVCLGQVHNTLNVPVEHVMVGIQLLGENGASVATKEAVLGRVWIPAGLAGPYRILFESVPKGYSGAYAFVESAQVATNIEERYASLSLQEVGILFTNGQYQVTLSVSNKSLLPAERLAVTVTLLDAEDRVTGFRQVYLDTQRRLQPGESLAITIKVIPQGANTVSFDAFAEGRLVLN